MEKQARFYELVLQNKELRELVNEVIKLHVENGKPNPFNVLAQAEN